MNIRKVVLVHSFNPPGPMRPVDADNDSRRPPGQWHITHVPTGEEHVLNEAQYRGRDFSLFSEAAQRDILIWIEEDDRIYKERRAAFVLPRRERGTILVRGHEVYSDSF